MTVPRMPQAAGLSQAHTDPEEIVLGVDTHKDLHVAAVINTLGRLLGTASFPTTAAGYQRCWSGQRGSVCCVGLGWSAPASMGQR